MLHWTGVICHGSNGKHRKNKTVKHTTMSTATVIIPAVPTQADVTNEINGARVLYRQVQIPSPTVEEAGYDAYSDAYTFNGPQTAIYEYSGADSDKLKQINLVDGDVKWVAKYRRWSNLGWRLTCLTIYTPNETSEHDYMFRLLDTTDEEVYLYAPTRKYRFNPRGDSAVVLVFGPKGLLYVLKDDLSYVEYMNPANGQKLVYKTLPWKNWKKPMAQAA